MKEARFWYLYTLIGLLALALTLTRVRLNRVAEGLISLNESVERMEKHIVQLEQVKE